MHMYAGNFFSHIYRDSPPPPGACGLHPYWTHTHLNLPPPRPTILDRTLLNPKPNSTRTLQQQSMYQCLTSEQNPIAFWTLKLLWNYNEISEWPCCKVYTRMHYLSIYLSIYIYIYIYPGMYIKKIFFLQ